MRKNKYYFLKKGKKIGVFLSLLFFFQAMSGVMCLAQQQNDRLTVEFKDTPMVEVLNYIRQNSKYDFLYNDTEIKKVPNVTASFSNAAVATILETCLKGTEYTFRIAQDVIVIQRRDKVESVIREISIRGQV